jgi:thymidylate synthase
MNKKLKMNNLDKQYTDLLQDILDNGVKKETRNGGTLSVFGRQIRHKMSDGFPLLTTKKMPFKTIVTELLWFLRGDTNIKYLVDNDCHIWDGDVYKNYSKKHFKEWEPGMEYESKESFINKIKTDHEFAKKWGDLGPIYGKQWRNWEGYHKSFDNETRYIKNVNGIDQIANLINDLKTNPDSRRLMVNAWNVGELDSMVLPPCHYGFQVYTRELSELERHDIKEQYGFDCRKLAKPSIKQLDDANIPTRAISLMWNQRSVDTFLGLPFNIASYGLLLEIIAKEVNMVPDELIGNLGDVHLYSNHIEQSKEQIGKELSMEERQELYAIYTEDSYGDEGELRSPITIDWEKIPKRTREPFPLPTLKHMKTDEFYKSLSDGMSLIGHLDPTDFILENYQSHPSIKAPLSN